MSSVHSIAIDLLMQQAGETQAEHQKLAREHSDAIKRGIRLQEEVAAERRTYEGLSKSIEQLGGDPLPEIPKEPWL